MKLLPKVGKYEFVAEPFHCDFSHHIFIGHLGNAMLNAADYHSNDRGYGMTYLNPIHKTWVLSRFAIEMDEMPMAYDKFSIETWVESAMKFFTSRNFAVVSPEGKVYGYGKSIWAMIDTDSRQPTDILAIHDGLIGDYIDKEKPCPIKASSRVKMGEDAELVRTIDTYYNDVDVNGHINSVKYIEHVLDLFDLDFYKHHFLKRIDIAYVAETYQGDKLSFYVEEEPCKEMNENLHTAYNIRVIKTTQNEGKDVEVVRISAIFVKK